MIKIMTKRLLAMVFYLIVVSLLSGCYYFMAEEPYLKKTQNEAERYIAEHPELDVNRQGLIRKGEIDVGFSKEEVKLSYNYAHPDKISITNDYGADEVWIYNEWSGVDFLYFKENKLIKIITIPNP
jgi:hypothetical protein